jgi:hypothetical protein
VIHDRNGPASSRLGSRASVTPIWHESQAEIGAALGIAASTVKSHVLHLFEKTGSRPQVDLVRLVADVSLPLSVASGGA